MFESKAKYTVWVGGIEISDYLLNKEDAEAVVKLWNDEGYDDVVMEKYRVNLKSFRGWLWYHYALTVLSLPFGVIGTLCLIILVLHVLLFIFGLPLVHVRYPLE